MRSTITLAAVPLLSLVAAASAAPPTAPRGGVEVTEIWVRKFRIVHGKPPIAGEMKLKLLVAIPPDSKLAGREFYFDKLTIEPVHDDTGKLLSPKDFASELEGRRPGVVTASHIGEGKAARSGPALEIYLDLPARKADTIRRLKGAIEVTAGKQETLTVKDVVKAAGKPIDSPKLVGLKVTPVVRKEKDKTVVALQITGNAERLLSWYPKNEGVKFSTMTEPVRRIDGGVELGEHVYPIEDSDADILSGMGLRLTVFVPTASQRFAFDLKDVELP